MKGEPDFTLISDEKLREFKDLTQQMIFAYKGCDEEKTRVLSEVWKQLSDECAERTYTSSIAELDSQEQKTVKPAVHKIKLVKSIKR